MRDSTAGSYKFLLLGIVLAALVLRIPGMMWGVHLHQWPHFLIYHPDEESLAGMAMQYLGGSAPGNFFYPKGYSFEVAVMALPFKRWILDHMWMLIMAGRFLSVIYSVLTVFLLFFIARRLFKNAQTALIACVVLAVTGLNVTYAHLAVVDSGVVFWIYATMYGALRCLDGEQIGIRNFLLTVVCCAMALAFKLSFIALIPLLYVLASRRSTWWVYVITAAAIFIIFEAASGLTYTMHDFQLTLDNVARDNMRSRDYNKLLNPLCYAFILVPLIGLPVFLGLVSGAWIALTNKLKIFSVRARDLVFIFLIPMAIHLMSICSLTFIAARHLLLFTPAFAVLAAVAIRYCAAKYTWRHTGFVSVLCGLLIYQLVFVASTEYYFVFDPREPANTWVKEHIPKGEKIALPSYSIMPNLWSRNKVVNDEEADYLILHEANYGRYLKSIVNPFIEFPTANQIHHAHEDEIHIIQGIFKEELPYRLLKKFEINPVTPEKMLYKFVYGNIWPMGDVSIYQKR